MASSQTYLNDWLWVPLLLFGWLPILYFSRLSSIPEYFEHRFGRPARNVVTALLLAYLIGNVGVNPEDDETADPVAEGLVVKWDPTEPSNWRAKSELREWLAKTGRIGIGGIDTRRLTRAIRQQGAPLCLMAEQQLVGFRPLEVQMSIVLPGEPDTTQHLDRLGGNPEERFRAMDTGRRCRHR